MRTFSLLLIIFFLPFIGSPQIVTKTDSTNKSKIYLDISFGSSIPMGYYARKDINFGGSGFATPGFLAQINLDWIGKSNSGLAIQYTYQKNDLISSIKNDTLKETYKAVGTGSWTNHYLMAGLVYLHSIDKVYVEGRALIGIVLSSSPLFNTVDPFDYTSSTNLGVGMAFSAQFGVGYKISPKVTVKANVEYTLANPQIHHQYGAQQSYDSITKQIIYSPPITVETKRTVSALLIKAGIVIKLSK